MTGRTDIPSPLVQKLQNEIKNLAQLKARLEGLPEDRVTDLFHILLVASLLLDASDAHIEPGKEGAKIRFRIDGLLHDVILIPFAFYETLLSRIKLVARIKLNVTDKPQDGRFSFTFLKNIVEARVATLPAEYGEAIVLRVLNPKNLIELPELGLRPEILRILYEELRKPNGMLLATGPTGSGKTTTLYAFLKEIQRPEVKVITIEDPIEYHLEGISQTQVHPDKGYDFASGLQAIVRQDPDVILVGEIRDKATAEIAIQAALTGHLVFSTLHTNGAPSTIARLSSLGTHPANIGAASNVIIGQRLVRKVCQSCATFAKVTPSEFTRIKKGMAGIKSLEAPAFSLQSKLARPRGCEQCNGTGYKGRVGVFEVMIVDGATEEFILQKPSASALRKFAVKQGMTPMYQDGLLKVLKGFTTMEELDRIIGKEKT